MASNPQPSANSPPPKPWEQSGSSSGPTPFKPPSPGSTSDVVEASGTARPGEIVSATERTVANNSNAIGRSVPTRPWEQQTYGSTLGGYGTGTGLNSISGYGSGMYGGSYGGLGGSYGGVGSYGGGMYGNSMYRGGMGGGLYGGSSMYGGGMYSGGLGGQMGGYGMGMGMGMGMGGPMGNQDPNNPYGAPPSPPGFWISFLRVMEGVVTFFGRVAILIDQNTQAFHMFISALLQLCDRSGMLYGELARFVLRLLGVRTKNKMVQQPPGPNGPHSQNGGQNYLEGGHPKAAAGPSGAWDGVWGTGPSN